MVRRVEQASRQGRNGRMSLLVRPLGGTRKPALALGVLAVGLLVYVVPCSATAERVYAKDQDHATIATCPYAGADVVSWDATKDLPANFIADQYGPSSGGLLIGLGYDDEGFWSARSDSEDACDLCNSLDLVHTKWSGVETSYEVMSSNERNELAQDPKATRDLVKQRLFSLAKTTWPVEKLRRDYALETPKHDAEGQIENFTGWFASVKAGGHELRFAQVAENVMCWCMGRWKGYALAKP